MLRFAKIFKTFTSIVFIASLLITYAYSIERGDVFINAEKTTTMPMESLFFMVLGLFVVLSLLFLLADRFLANYRRNKRFAGSILSGERFPAWLQFFQASVHILLACAFAFVGILNSDEGLRLLDYSFFLYVGPLVVVIALFSLPWVFFSRQAI